MVQMVQFSYLGSLGRERGDVNAQILKTANRFFVNYQGSPRNARKIVADEGQNTASVMLIRSLSSLALKRFIIGEENKREEPD